MGVRGEWVFFGVGYVWAFGLVVEGGFGEFIVKSYYLLSLYYAFGIVVGVAYIIFLSFCSSCRLVYYFFLWLRK